MGALKLNLASGTDIRPGWMNLDVVPQWPDGQRCDIVWDARRDIIPFDANSADEIYAGYLLLHLAPCYHAKVLSEIYRVAKDQGRCNIVFGEVDMEKVMTKFLNNPSDSRLAELIWGEQGQTEAEGKDARWNEYAEWDKHCHGFTPASLYTALRNAGFESQHRISIHSPDVWYELTVACTKP